MVRATLLAGLAVLSATGSGQSSPTPQDATTFALTYGYPLLAFEKLARPLIRTIGVNQVYHARTLSTAANTSVVTPNVDTLYSTAILDLSHNAVSIAPGQNLARGEKSIAIPSDQFVLFSFYDPFGDNWVNAGTGHADNGKSWVVRQKPANVSSYGAQTAQDDGQVYLNSPSAYTILLIRWLVNATNINLIHTLQDQLLVANTTEAAETEHPWLSSLHGVDSSKSPAINALNLLAQYAPASNPTVASDAGTVRQQLEAAGVLSANTTALTNVTTAALQPGVDLDKSNQTALAAAASAAAQAAESRGNGWSTIRANKTGSFGTDYPLRASVAASGYLMLTAPDAIYPTWQNVSAAATTAANSSRSSSSNTILSPGEALLYTFSGKPPLAGTGFWSLTLYNLDNYLVANARNVYAVGDRSNLTYADGTPVYGGANTNSSSSRAFQVLVQPASVVPPGNWTANWLPAPDYGQGFHVVLRWYGAEDGLLVAGGYEYPRVARVGAITSRTVNGTGSGGGGGGGGSGDGAGRSAAGMLRMNGMAILLCAGLSLALFW